MTLQDITATKQRILNAALKEFGTHGLSGARIDRIAKNGNASKERLYAYFGNKAALFHAVLDADFAEAMESVAWADDIPQHAVNLFDAMTSKPYIQRMLIWGQLQGEGPRMRRQSEGHPSWIPRRAAIRKAQDDGIVAAHWNPEDLITLIFGLVFAWGVTPGSVDNQSADAQELTRRRNLVYVATVRLCKP
ncbi:TetR family transcriptional regulator (plasmid) [Rhodococcus erythropolis R138]|uniref:TetR family transcriptional regulator n=1 Tax=Rhodococcus erythropolis TaxID=1833 RepID=UPI000492B15C|nr:TetR family transcriptional regulator [Rhodococcus erythropolis]ALU73438.1 TetR family transcriptional regulator [Rhodococcus erythropolis R138]